MNKSSNEEIKIKTCKTCNQQLEITKFNRDGNYYRTSCKECQSDMRKLRQNKSRQSGTELSSTETNSESSHEENEHRICKTSKQEGEVKKIHRNANHYHTSYNKYNELWKSYEPATKTQTKIIVDFISYLKERPIEINSGTWMYDLLLPLLKKTVVIITPAILSWLGFSESKTDSLVKTTGLLEICSSYDPSQNYINAQLNKFLDCLDVCDIKYMELKHNDVLALTLPYCTSEMDYLETKNKAQHMISKKVWIAMEVSIFKEAIMKLNVTSNTRCSFSRLENTALQYIREEYDNIIKNEKEKNSRLQLYIRNTKRVENNEWIYIATSDTYAPQMKYKVGSTTRLSKRLNSYQTGRSQEDHFFYVNVFKCSDSTEVDRRVRFHLREYKASTILASTNQSLSPNKKQIQDDKTELYIVEYNFLVKIVTSIVESFNGTVDIMNDYVDELPLLLNGKVVIPKPLDLKSI